MAEPGTDEAATASRPAGMRAFTLIWAGQLVSFLGSGMTLFALIFWAWQLSGSATVLALMAFFSFAPGIIFTPFAGALVDRWNRRLVMMLSDMAAALATGILLALFVSDLLQIWHLYVLGAFAGVFGSFQFPAFSAAITLMIPKKQYTRASGMLSLAGSVSAIFAPPLAAALLVFAGIAVIFVIDLATFAVALGTLLIVHIPQPKESAVGREARGSLWKDAAYGFNYVRKRPSLLGLLLVFSVLNLIFNLAFVLLAPMILARTGDDVLILGSVTPFFGAGSVVGSVLLIAWGGPKRRIHGILLGVFFSSLLGTVLMGLGREVLVWAVAAFFSSFFIPIANGSSQAIWQSKVEPDVQGRVFAARGFIAQATAPVGMILAGVLSDFVFEPAMQAGGALEGVLGGIFGTGPGSGMAVLFVVTGVLGVASSLGGYAFKSVRDVETILPDFDAGLAEAPDEPSTAEGK